jgi:hypothetical protein
MTAAVDLAAVRRAALCAFIPPPKLALSGWIERNINLPADVSALPGSVRLWPYPTRHCRRDQRPGDRANHGR